MKGQIHIEKNFFKFVSIFFFTNKINLEYTPVICLNYTAKKTSFFKDSNLIYYATPLKNYAKKTFSG